MTKRLIEIDDAKLGAVRDTLGTGTIKATIDGALDEVLKLAARRRALLDEPNVGGDDLAESEARRQAWG